ncbi:acyltransferase domain-containing protein [Streptomyces sp. NPDC002559]
MTARVTSGPAGAGASAPGACRHVLGLSAPGPGELAAAAARLADVLRENPRLPLHTLARSLGTAPHYPARLAVVAADAVEAAEALTDGEHPARVQGTAVPGEQSVVFLLPGVGDHHPGMVAGPYRSLPRFRRRLDEVAELLLPVLGADVREALDLSEAVLAPPQPAGIDLAALMASRRAGPAHRGGFDRPLTAQPLVFAVEYATAGLLIDVGLRPAALLGYSIGECTAMCLAGVLDLPRAAAFVAARARAIEATAAAAPPGAMTAVVAGAEELTGLLGDDAVLAAVDGPHLCVLAGPADGLAKVEDRLDGAGIASRRLPVEFAFHSPAMAGAVAPVEEAAARAGLSAPATPMLSNLTGGWLTAEQATDPAYWSGQLRHTVRFDENLANALALPGPVLIEVGPGRSLGTLGRTHPAAGRDTGVLATLGAPGEPDPFARALAGAWVRGLPVDLSVVAELSED